MATVRKALILNIERRLRPMWSIKVLGLLNKIPDHPECMLLFIGATNRPYDIDEAFRRRLSKRLYVPLPVQDARLQLLKYQLEDYDNTLSEDQLSRVASRTEGFSGADLKELLGDAVKGPMRELGNKLETDSTLALRAVTFKDFEVSLKKIKPSVSYNDIKDHVRFNKEFGSQ